MGSWEACSTPLKIMICVTNSLHSCINRGYLVNSFLVFTCHRISLLGLHIMWPSWVLITGCVILLVLFAFVVALLIVLLFAICYTLFWLLARCCAYVTVIMPLYSVMII